MIAADHPVVQEWITDAEMAANSDLIKTMNVKPPTGQGRVRLIRIGDVDLQPCGGTHVRKTGEIGPVELGKVENKGKQNSALTCCSPARIVAGRRRIEDLVNTKAAQGRDLA